ncbi:hypothetical protein K491DRAFT_43212 [Lophiostoma macrostomum CBS 122681]|uniref:Secreted protein n=1 Tax=Lophiostoma macrostomum CBS 122681 TaxID=1314788 RepID=A0A6A6T0E2_9PLEO|nr:hypothetical protein K491DRAFT_43212 [Lophiostoma macrostomum CBS 122681]
MHCLRMLALCWCGAPWVSTCEVIPKLRACKWDVVGPSRIRAAARPDTESIVDGRTGVEVGCQRTRSYQSRVHHLLYAYNLAVTLIRESLRYRQGTQSCQIRAQTYRRSEVKVTTKCKVKGLEDG